METKTRRKKMSMGSAIGTIIGAILGLVICLVAYYWDKINNKENEE